MALPNYYSPITQDALELAGMSPAQYKSFVSEYKQAFALPQYGPGNPKPIGRQEVLTRNMLDRQNALQAKMDGLSPYFMQAQQRAAIRQQEDLRKYQRDYRRQISGNGAGGNSQYISGSGDRMRGIPPTGSQGVTQSGVSARGVIGRPISDPVTQSFNQLSAVRS
jgi:hypothetical protein